MSGIRAKEKTNFNVDNEFIHRHLQSINTILFGEITSVSGNKATIEISNKYPKQLDTGELIYVPYGSITTNFATLTLFKYVPKEGDKVIVLVSQSDIQNFLGNGAATSYPSMFNISDSLVIPIDPFYSDNTKIDIGLSDLDINISAKDYQSSSEVFKIVNSLTSDNLLKLISDTLTAIGAVTVSGVTINTLTGGIVDTNATKISGFSGV